MFTQPALARSAKASPRSRSPVKTAVVSPNGEALVSRSASAAELTSTIGTTGPKVSSRSMAIPGVTPSRTVGSANRLVGSPGARAPAGADPCSAGDRVGDVPVELGRRRLVVQRSHRRLRVERVAEPHTRLRRLDHPLGELRPHACLHEEPLARRAALPRAQVGGLERRLRGELQVGVVEDHHRAVAAQLEQLGLARGARRHLAAGLHRADETYAGDQRMPDHGVTDNRAWPGDEVEHASGQTRLLKDLGQQRATGRRGRRRDPDDGVAGGQRRREDLGTHRVRPVPRADDADHAERHPRGEHPAVRRGRRGQRAGHPLGVLARHREVDRRARRPRRRPRRPAACPGPGRAPWPARRAGPRWRRRSARRRRPARTAMRPTTPRTPQRPRPRPRRRRPDSATATVAKVSPVDGLAACAVPPRPRRQLPPM